MAQVKGQILYLIQEIDPISDHKSDSFIAICFKSVDRTTISQTDRSRSPFGGPEHSPESTLFNQINSQRLGKFGSNAADYESGNINNLGASSSASITKQKKQKGEEIPQETLLRSKSFYKEFFSYPSSPELIRNKSLDVKKIVQKSKFNPKDEEERKEERETDDLTATQIKVWLVE